MKNYNFFNKSKIVSQLDGECNFRITSLEQLQNSYPVLGIYLKLVGARLRSSILKIRFYGVRENYRIRSTLRVIFRRQKVTDEGWKYETFFSRWIPQKNRTQLPTRPYIKGQEIRMHKNSQVFTRVRAPFEKCVDTNHFAVLFSTVCRRISFEKEATVSRESFLQKKKKSSLVASMFL